MAQAQCRHCGASFAVQTVSGINAATQPALAARLLEGSLFVHGCPRCGTRNLCAFPLLYHDPGKRLMVWLQPPAGSDTTPQAATPQAATQAQRTPKGQQASLWREAEQLAAHLQGYTLRKVSTAGELLEKTRLAQDGLDDVAMELAKWVLRRELAGGNAAAVSDMQQTPREAGSPPDAPLKYAGLDKASGQLTFAQPLPDGQVRQFQASVSLYDDALGILSRHAEIRPAPGFATVDAAFVERFL